MRIFHCYDCNHKLRFGAKQCGRCFTPTPLYNRRIVVFGGVILVLGAAIAAIA